MTDSVIRVDLDVLLDTRLATYTLMGADVESILNQGYGDRIYDRFEGVDYEEYRKKYAERDKEYLKIAPMTSAITMLKSLVTSLEHNNINGVEKQLNIIEINLAPYKLSTSETVVLLEAIQLKIDMPEIIVRTVNIPYVEQTPFKLISDDVSIYIMYDYSEWFRELGDKIWKDEQCPGITVITAMLVTQETDNLKETVHPPDIGEDNSFELIEKYFNPIVSLKFVISPMFNAWMLDEPNQDSPHPK